MAAQRWRRIIDTIVGSWIEGSLALDPQAYAAATWASWPDALEDAAITRYHRAEDEPARATQPATAHVTLAAMRLDVQAS